MIVTPYFDFVRLTRYRRVFIRGYFDVLTNYLYTEGIFSYVIKFIILR